jgi:putative redox protein
MRKNMRKKIEFLSNGVSLAGALEIPEGATRCYALFAHCFTCGKDVAAASRISRALTAQNIAVLRFDFTGLGGSDGDFANTNFSSNVQDLLAAVDFLRREHQAPQLLVGHSLGGSAVLAMAADVPEVKAVATIGAPHKAEHVGKNFAADLDVIQRDGEAEVNLAGRSFKITRQFVEDIQSHGGGDLGSLRKALLVMHSPIDTTVDIQEAEKIYREARHPKSFVGLDDADHLLTRKQDSEYVAKLIAAWASRYLPPTQLPTRPQVAKGEVLVAEKNQKFTQNVYSDTHHWLGDEPTAMGGADLGPDPYEHLLAALGTCTAMTLRMYAQRKSLPLQHVEVTLSHAREHVEDCIGCEQTGARIDVLNRVVSLTGDLNQEQRAKLLSIADRCPVHRTLHNQLEVRTTLHE